MRIKLEGKDAMELSLAAKRGELDTDRVGCLQPLASGYNPPRRISIAECDYHLDCLFRGWGIKPSGERALLKWMRAELPQGLLECLSDGMADGQLYRGMVRDVLVGLCTLKSMGYSIDIGQMANPDFGFMEAGGVVPDFHGGAC